MEQKPDQLNSACGQCDKCALTAKHEALLAASRRVVAAFVRLGETRSTYSMLAARRECEAAMVALSKVAK